MIQKTILCYGDSNTWGYVPCSDYSLPKARYARNERWPGILQEILGNSFYVVEEGLNSRTTNLDYAPPPDRNGKTYLPSCLYSHAPIDLVILALGGNDTKTYFDRSSEEIKNGLSELVNIIQASAYGTKLQVPPKILIIPPAIPLPFVENFIDENGIYFLKGAVKKNEELNFLYLQLAEENGCFYLDLSEIRPSEIDGIHYDKTAHKKCAEMMSKKIQNIFKAE
jgi:lysophospholipase L1-like esterase